MLSALLLSLLSCPDCLPVCAGDGSTLAQSSIGKRDNLANGIYLVTQEGPTSKAITPATENEQVELYDFRLMNPTDKEDPIYVVLQKSPFIPITLDCVPGKDKDSEGKPKLMLQLTHGQIAPLEKFTRENCGKPIAIVIGGKIVSKHKIRTVIEGGKLQITRCTDNGCEKIYSTLVEDLKKRESR